MNINSLAGTGSVEFESNMTGPLNESVVLKIAGKNADGTEMATPFDLSDLDSWKQNSPAQSYDASALQVLYGGSGNIVMKGGNNQSAATVYAPNAGFHLQGHPGSVRVDPGQDDYERWQRQHSLRPPPLQRLLRRRPTDDRHLHLETLLSA